MSNSNKSIPSALALYFQSCCSQSLLTLVTSVLNTPANWLLLRFVVASLYGVDDEVGANQASRTRDNAGASADRVVFVSFLRSYEFWQETGKKIGLDFTSIISKKQLVYIDGLMLGLGTSHKAANVIKPKSLSLQDIRTSILAAAPASSEGSTPVGRTTVIVDGLDFVLASQPEISALALESFITSLQDRYDNVILSVAADSPLIHNIEASATPLERQHGIFARSMAYQSGWVFQLRPLETGHAKDVSGVIQISKGGGNVADDPLLTDGEWLYQLRGDGTVNVWSRGQQQ